MPRGARVASSPCWFSVLTGRDSAWRRGSPCRAGRRRPGRAGRLRCPPSASKVGGMEKMLTSVAGAGPPRMLIALPMAVMVRLAPPFGPKAPLLRCSQLSNDGRAQAVPTAMPFSQHCWNGCRTVAPLEAARAPAGVAAEAGEDAALDAGRAAGVVGRRRARPGDGAGREREGHRQRADVEPSRPAGSRGWSDRIAAEAVVCRRARVAVVRAADAAAGRAERARLDAGDGAARIGGRVAGEEEDRRERQVESWSRPCCSRHGAGGAPADRVQHADAGRRAARVRHRQRARRRGSRAPCRCGCCRSAPTSWRRGWPSGPCRR